MPLVARAQYSPVWVGLFATTPPGQVSGGSFIVLAQRLAGTVAVKLHVLGVVLKISAMG